MEPFNQTVEIGCACAVASVPQDEKPKQDEQKNKETNKEED